MRRWGDGDGHPGYVPLGSLLPSLSLYPLLKRQGENTYYTETGHGWPLNFCPVSPLILLSWGPQGPPDPVASCPCFSHLPLSLDAAEHGSLLLKDFPIFYYQSLLVPLFHSVLASSSPQRHLAQVSFSSCSISYLERVRPRGLLVNRGSRPHISSFLYLLSAK